MTGPGHDFPPCPEWNSGPVDEDVAHRVEEFARWVNYLLHPEQHDGPRHYVCADCGYGFDTNHKWEQRELNAEAHDFPPERGRSGGHSWTEWELHSVIEGFDPASVFHALHATSGMWFRGSMQDCFSKLADGHLCQTVKAKPGNSPVYRRDESFTKFATALDEVLAGVADDDPRHEAIKSYHASVKQYALSHENQMFNLAEALGRYRGAFLGARNQILSRMDAMVGVFKEKLADHPGKSPWDGVRDVLIPIALKAIFSAVRVGGGVPGAVAFGFISDAVAGLIAGWIHTDDAEREYPKKVPAGATTWEHTWRQNVDWFATEADRIANDLLISVDPNAGTYGGMSHIMYTQQVEMCNDIGPGAVHVPEPPAFVPKA